MSAMIESLAREYLDTLRDLRKLDRAEDNDEMFTWLNSQLMTLHHQMVEILGLEYTETPGEDLAKRILRGAL